MIAAASQEYITVPPHVAFALVSPDTIRRALRSPARTRRRWLRDHLRKRATVKVIGTPTTAARTCSTSRVGGPP